MDFAPSVNVQDNNGNTPLHYAAVYGDTLMAQHLLDLGADIYSKNKQGFSVFALAVANNQLAFAQYLNKRYYIDFNENIGSSSNVLSYALQTDNNELIAFIEDNGGEFNKKPNYSSVLVGVNQLFNTDDYLLGYEIRIVESKYKFEAGLLYSSRAFLFENTYCPQRRI
jgi:ankyrin repeat protein